ncbi:MAG: sugar ABC transporter permease [Chloroflexota bacterium]|nr:sugar ABC transporter permease [Chloroflexota bacterium]
MVPKIMKQGALTPWLYLLAALIIMAVFIVYPTVNTFMLSLRDKTGTQSAAADCRPGQPCWGIFENYRYALTDPEMVQALRNNALWILLTVPGTVGAGLLFAVLTDRVRYEKLAKTMIFLPMAISFVGAGIIWKFVYYLETGEGAQIGVLNAIITGLGGNPVAWLTNRNWIVNNISLWIVWIWLWSGFCMTILSAALKAVPAEILEASRVDGANEWQVFWQIMFPIILPTVTVVATTMVINVLKVFDIVFVMTNGLNGTEVIANRMFKFIVTNQGRSMAIAVLLIVLTIPIMIINVQRFREQEMIR